MVEKYKMSMVKKNGEKDYYGIFNSKEEAVNMAEEFMSFDKNYVDYVIWYTE